MINILYQTFLWEDILFIARASLTQGCNSEETMDNWSVGKSKFEIHFLSMKTGHSFVI